MQHMKKNIIREEKLDILKRLDTCGLQNLKRLQIDRKSG